MSRRQTAEQRCFVVFFSWSVQRHQSEKWWGAAGEVRDATEDSRREEVNPLKRLESTCPGSRNTARLCEPLRSVSGGGLWRWEDHYQALNRSSGWWLVTVDGQQVSEQSRRAADTMPGDGFTIKSRIRKLLRSPSTKQKKNRKETLSSKVFIHASGLE